ncbi:HET-R [Lasiosphaeria hispida]|uniref:HET-R n=1 Tax=Lasiosphaeria hispida TaxID=260671 RepID=A0AAJ0HWL1_9PEZI|nr:HET-R [Lasiosphaeria hispida]
MRLLEHDGAGGFRLTKRLPNDAVPKIPPYAILSHTWGDAEVLFKDLEDGTAKSKAAYAKIRFCGARAEHEGLKFFWVDTCCIDKSDHVELEHALNSMFQWYRDAAKCFVYLADVPALKRDADGHLKWRLGFQKCRWLTRGWTLQELIAPASVEFFSKEGERLGDKRSLEKEIHDSTGIPLRALQGNPLSDFSVDQRMAWIEKRETCYEEDKVYALFGIFDVHIPVVYGEGKLKALRRLRDKIHEDYRCLSKLWSAGPRDPCHDKERIELAKGGLLADAYRWVFDNPDFKRWRYLPESRLLWIKGDPGKGKTMLLCGIINELEGPITADGGNLAYFFCQATDSHINSATAVIRGLIHLLARRQPRLLSHLPENTYPSNDAMAWIVLSKVLQEMLQDPNLKVTHLVIDALDECVTDLPRLLELVAQTSSTSPCVKWVVSSRNLPHIEEQLVAIAQHSRLSLELNAESVTAAISHSEDADLCKQILAVTTIVHRPISLQELTTLVEMPDDISNDVESLEEVVKVCGSFLTLREQVIYFVHQSAKDFLLGKATHQASRDAFNWVFPLGLEDANHFIFSRSLNAMSAVLRRDMYGLEEPGFPADKVQTPSSDPLAAVRYSCVFWVDHFHDSISNKNTVQRNTYHAVHTFLEQKYLYWLEALSLLQAMPKGVIAIQKLEGILTLEVHNLVLSIAFSPDGQRLASGLSDKTIKIWDPMSGQCLETLQGHRNWVVSVAFSPDGQRLTSGSADKTIKIWDPTSGQCLETLQGHHSWVSSVAFSPDGQRLASGSFDKTIKIWDPTSRQCLETLQGHHGLVQSIAFSPDGQRLASGLSDKTIKIWDPMSGQCLETLQGHHNCVSSVAFSLDGQRLASGSDDKMIKIWDPMSGQCLETLQGHYGSVQSIAFSPDGQHLASGSADKTIKIWDPTSGQCLETLQGHHSMVESVTFSPDGQCLVSGSDDKIKIWDPMSGQCLETLQGHHGKVLSIAFSPDGQRLASGSNDNMIKIWDPASGQCLETEGHRSIVWTVAFSLDGQRLTSGSFDKTIKIWDPVSGQCLETLQGHHGLVQSIAFSPDGQRLASGSDDKTIKIWDPTLGQCLETLQGHHNCVSSVAFSPDGQRLTSGSADKTIKIWDPTSGQCLETLQGHHSWVSSVAFSPDGQRLASGSDDKMIKIWDPMSGQCLETLQGHHSWVLSVAFSPDGQRLASGSADKTIKIWDPASGQCLETLQGHHSMVESVAFSPDGQCLVSGSDDKIKIWDPMSGQCLETLQGHHGKVLSIAFSLDGQRLASGSADKTIKIWDPASGQCLETLQGPETFQRLKTLRNRQILQDHRDLVHLTPGGSGRLCYFIHILSPKNSLIGFKSGE